MGESISAGSVATDVDTLVKYLETSPIRLAVFGEFSAGKTTVLNALIGEEILSVAVEPTTAVPTRVRYGREFNVFVERTDGERLALFEDDPPFWTRFVGRRDTLSTLQKQQVTIRDFLRTWTKEGERADAVARVVIELPLDWLKGGLELVDTPGVNNEFVRHQGFTEQEAGAADIAVLLMDARQGGGKRTEFEFMNEVQAQVERCLVAPNKLDLVPADEREEFLTYIRETALPKHWDGAVTPPVHGISALAALHPDEYDESALVEAFADLRGRLETMAEEERGKLLLARKGNPEKELFGRAKELEGAEHYGRAHRLYFDLLDVLEAAGLDPTPAEEGIARCEEHLSAQVDALDTLNERYNEAMALAEEDPDAALEQLEAIRDEKKDLRLKDGDLQATIEQLKGRIKERDAVRQKIRQLRKRVEEYRRNGELIGAVETAKKTLPLIEAAELSEDEEQELRVFIEKQEADREKWKERRRGVAEEALQIADENPDAALRQLREVYDERRTLDVSDVDLEEKIRMLEERVRSRDEARKEIRALKEKDENYRHGWVGKAVDNAREILTHLEEADLSSEKEESLRDFVHQVCESCKERARKRWKELKDKADVCVAEHRYVNAEDYLGDLEELAPYTPFEAETEAFVEEVEKKASLEADYQDAVRHAIEEAEVLRENQVSPAKAENVEAVIETARERYQELYGEIDLPDGPKIDEIGLPLTLHQKQTIARRILGVAQEAPVQEMAESLLEDIQSRLKKISDLEFSPNRNIVNFLCKHRDHPKINNITHHLSEEDISEEIPIRKLRVLRDILSQKWEESKEVDALSNLKEVERYIELRSSAFKGMIRVNLVDIAKRLGASDLTFKDEEEIKDYILNSEETEIPNGDLILNDGVDVKLDGEFREESSGGGNSEDFRVGRDWSERSGNSVGTWYCPSCGRETTKEDGKIGADCGECGAKMKFEVETIFTRESRILVVLVLSFVIILVAILLG